MVFVVMMLFVMMVIVVMSQVAVTAGRRRIIVADPLFGDLLSFFGLLVCDYCLASYQTHL
jgi:hypothetical protein